MWLTLQAWTELAYVDLVGICGFRAVRRVVLRTSTRPQTSPAPETTARVVAALETACAWYLRQTRCLLRAAVATRLLRRHGVPADLVIGCQHAPLKAHAWVTVADTIVSDDLDGLEHYQILDRW